MGSEVKELRDEVDHYKRVLANLHEGYVVINAQGLIREANPAFCEMVGYAKEELLSMNLSDLRPNKTLKEQKQLINAVKREGSMEFEALYHRKDGVRVDLQIRATAVDKGDEIYLTGLVRDITQYKKRVRELKGHQEGLRTLFGHSPHPVYFMDLEGNYLGVNSRMLELTGYSREELLKKNFDQLIAKKDLEKTRAHFKKAKRGQIQDYEIMGITKQGEQRPAHVMNFPMIIDNEVVGVFGMAEDITERREFERKLIESEQRWHRLVDENPQCVLLTVGNEIIYINKAGADMLGAGSPEEIIGRSTFDFVHPDYEGIVGKMPDNSKTGDPQPASEQKIVDINGREIDVLIHSVAVKYKGKDAVQSVLHDITERKQKEQLIQSSLAEKRVMLQEIHHRVKNNMAVVSSLLELQAMNIKDEQTQQLLTDCQLRIHSMAMVHEKLYASKELSKISFDAYIKELSQTIINSTGVKSKSITVRYRLDKVELNINQAIPCGLILNELIVNAFKHAFENQDTGTILIGISETKGTVKFWVEDSGCGLPDNFKIDNQESMGMTLVSTLTQQVDGELLFKNDQNNLGACFQLTMELEQ